MEDIKEREIVSLNEIEALRIEVEKLEDKNIREMSYDETMEKWVRELESFDIDKIPSWWWTEFDSTLWMLMPWQVYAIGWITGTWKSTFINQICQNISQQGFRVSLYTLEDRIQTIRQNDLYFAINKIRRDYQQVWLEKWKFMSWQYKNIPELAQARRNLEEKNKNIYMLKHDGMVNIKTIEFMIQEAAKAGSKVICLDHLHYFDSSENVAGDRHDLVIKDIMHRINFLARELNITILLVAHYKKLASWQKPSLNDFSWSISIAQIVNAIIHLYRDKSDELENKTEFIIDKNRDMGITKTITWTFDINFYEYKFDQSIFQKRRVQRL